MDPKSTTDVDNPSADAGTPSTTSTDPAASTDTKTASTGDNLDPSKSDDTTVVSDDDKSKDTTIKPDEAPASKFDTDLDDWIEKGNRPKPETDEQRQVLQDLRNSQREFTRSQQEKREAADAKALGEEVHKAKTDTAEEDDDDLDPLEKRQNKIEADLAAERTTRQQSEFYLTNKVTEEEHKALLDIYREKTSRPVSSEAKKAAVEYWSSVDALPDLLDLAKAKLSKPVDTAVIKDEAAREERERIARESESKSPSRSASVPDLNDKTPDQERTERLKARYSSNKS